MSDSDSSESEGFSTAKFRAYLKTLRHQLDHEMNVLSQYIQVQESNCLTKSYPLTQSAQVFFQTKEASIETMFRSLLNTWKSEGRLGFSGKSVCLNQNEAVLFHKKLHQEIPFTTIVRYLSKLQISHS